MRKAISVVSTLLFLLGLTVKVGAVESTWEFSVQVSANVQESPALITLTWPQDTYMAPNSYTIYRKAPGATSWGTGTTLPGTSTSYTDSNVSVGTAYEYQVVKSTSLYTGYGYLYGGIKVAANENRGKLLLVLDKTYAAQLTSELGRLQQDLTGDGWTVIRLDVNRNDSPATVKDLIKAQYNADPQNVKSVFLFGHVPVPYSGNMVPDGHAPEHYGAWPCDAFYGDMDGTWTDNSVNNTGGSDPRTRNVPGDGKLDQSVLPSALELMVGRVDLANMPGRTSWGGPATFPNELELLRNYLSKDHKFRHKEMELPRRALVGDFFGTRDGEAFAASGWRNFAPFFGANNVSFTPDKGTWISQLAANSYLWAYGCGAGTYTSMGGLGTSGSYNDVTTTEIYQNNIKAAFTLFFGSWLGDWDSEDNIMRSVLALPTYGLVSAWSGRPHWFLHHMALGEPIGFGARLTQNNGANGLYRNQINSVAGHTHAALMGDPTLRMHPVGPATSATASSVSGGVQVSWTAAKDSVLGYYVYRAPSANGPFTRLTPTPVTGTSWLDNSASGTQSYMVRAIKLETSASGTYYNLSQGAFITGTGSVTNQPGNINTNTTGSGTTNTPSSNNPATNVTTSYWVDDSLPPGGAPGATGGDTWNWVTSNPTPVSGSKAHQSALASGLHEHYFSWATAGMPVAEDEVLVTHVYLDPSNPPSEVMVQWFDGTWEHRAYWGANRITYGINGTAGRRFMGTLPTPGKWVRLEVPAEYVNLENRNVTGMAFSAFDGKATWDAAGRATALSTNPPPVTNTNAPGNTVTNVGTQVAWIDDAIPAGAQAGADGGDGWVWTSSNPTPLSGAKAHPSTIASGLHQHYFVGASATLPVATGEKLFAYVYIDPANPPRQIMLQWNDGNWDHRAYWGENFISYGVYGTTGRRYMGPIPAAGQWVRLEVPASQVGLEGRTLNGMAFSTYDGRAIWDLAGKSSDTVTNPPVQNPVTNTPPALTNSVVWMEDALPAGSSPGSEGGDTWNWVSSSPTAFSGSKAVKSSAAGGLHQIYFTGATTGLTVGAGETLFAYVYLDPANLPSQVMLQWNDGSWDHRAYWGGNYIGYGTKDTPGRRYMGPLPASGKWVRLEVPASLVDLEGRTINGMALSLYDGQASWDCAGKTTLAAPPSGGGNTNTPVPTPTNSVSVSVWVDDNIPSGAKSGADGGDSWSWVQGSPAPLSGTRSHQSSVGSGLHQHYFYDASQKLTVETGESLFAYVYLDPSTPPSQIMLQWNDGSWDHRAYWGANRIQYGTDNSESKRYMGPLPATGKWVLLQVPASQLGLEGKTLNGMAFSQYDGRVAWDYAGKASGLLTNTPPVTTNSPPAVTNNPPVITNQPPVSTNLIPSTNVLDVSAIDYITPELPKVGDNTLHVLSPNLLELKLINTKQPDPARVTAWDLVDANGQFQTPAASSFEVTADGKQIGVASVGFKRRPIYASLAGYDLRIENSLYLQLASPISDNQSIEVKNPSGTLWNSAMKFAAKSEPLRYSPAIHVNQEGYMPNHIKKAMVGYYSGSMGEMNIPSGAGFKLVDAATGVQVFQGALTQRLDSGYTYSPTPYQKVYEANFTSFNTPGEYRLVVPGLGGSLPFLINEGIAMAFARTYALGLFHQRCGANLGLPHTRFSHDKCHTAQASVPSNAEQFAFTWTAIAENAKVINNNNPPQIAPALTSPSAQLFPYVNQGTVNVAGGHHDAGDYSKYTANSASLVHYLLFAVDSLPGVAALDNLGIAESGDGISDVLQEAKWESDFLARMQDADGGFYFLVYPRERKYEIDVAPDKGDAQVVWPKTMSATAASVAALAQCASSPAFKKAYPAEATQYLQKARLGWQFLLNSINKYGKTGAYQKITHYGDDFADSDELAWAAAEMFLATGDTAIHQTLKSWFDPADPATTRWGWWHMSQCYGHAIRSYAFAARSGRIAASQLDASYLAKCEAEIKKAGDDVVNWAAINAYGSSFPDATKRVLSAGWYFSTDQAFDLAVAYQINPQASYIDAIVSNMNFEGGVNPVNVTFITGLGWKRQRDVVNQWALNDTRVLPPSGQPIGNITGTFGYLWNYGSMLQALNFPSDSATTAPYPFYDRWGDSWNVNAEFVVINQARSLAALGFLAGRTALKSQTWKAPAATLSVPTKTVEVGQPVTITMQVPGLDTSEARITWEARDQEPAFGHSFVYAPKNNGQQWVEAEAQWPDGRRAFARATFNANAADIVWVDDAIPSGATSGADGGDSWNWVTSNPAPQKGTAAHQSAMAAGSHQHYFDGATATLSIGTGDVLYAWVYLDPANPPKQIMLQWNDGSWDHRAFWGADLLGYGVSGTPGRKSMGALPAAGTWVQLKVPASQVNLEGKTIRGMAFTAYDGKVTWDAAGRLSTDTGTVASRVSVTLPTTRISRLEPKAAEFQVIRTGDTNSALLVTYTFAGSAQAGTDYDCGNVSGPVVISPGQTVATIPITPKNSSSPTGADSIVLALASGSDYLVGNPASATLMLEGNTVPVKSLAIKGGRATLSWTSIANRTYRVAYKDDLNAPEWKNVASAITAQSNLSTWTDDGAGQAPSRYYMVAQVN